MTAPRGRIVRTMRLSSEDEGAILRVSGNGILVYVHQNAKSRRTFARQCEALGVTAEPVRGADTTSAEGTYNRRTGALERRDETIPHVFQCVGTVNALRALATHPCVERWEFAVGVRVPFTSSGSGTEKPRPSSGTTFGKPATVKATAVALARQTYIAVQTERNHWESFTELQTEPVRETAYVESFR